MSKKASTSPQEILCQEDAAAVAMRSVAAALRGKTLDVWQLGTWQQRALRLVTVGGKKAINAALDRWITTTSVEPESARRITSHALATWATSLYDEVEGPWNALVIGAPNGGVAHLATALGVPFLSQQFSVNYRDPTPVDDVNAYLEFGQELAQAALRRNSDLAVINHYDPLHKRAWLKHTNQVRYKLLDLPEAYQAFIFQNLPPGGTIIFTDCRLSWPMYFLGERHWFQVGGLGTVAPKDFIEGKHPKIAALQAAAGAEPVGNWGLDGKMAFEMPEAEWGTLPPLHDRVAAFARENAYEFISLEGAHPEYFSYLAFRLWQRLLKRAGIEPQGVLLETFLQVAPTAVRRAALLPIWLPSGDAQSIEFYQRVRRDLKLMPELQNKPLLWLPMPDFADTFETASWEAWLDVLSQSEGQETWDVQPIGMDPHLYPVDPAALYTAYQSMLDWTEDHVFPMEVIASVDFLREEVRAIRRQRS